MPCRRYAARIVDDEGQLVILGFEDRGKANFVGKIMDPEPVDIDQNGLLFVRPEQKAAE
jgi:beta-fructofuranosidase